LEGQHTYYQKQQQKQQQKLLLLLIMRRIARQRVAKHILVATNTMATIKELPFLGNGR
jgi:hypothetical protein